MAKQKKAPMTSLTPETPVEEVKNETTAPVKSEEVTEVKPLETKKVEEKVTENVSVEPEAAVKPTYTGPESVYEKALKNIEKRKIAQPQREGKVITTTDRHR